MEVNENCSFSILSINQKLLVLKSTSLLHFWTPLYSLLWTEYTQSPYQIHIGWDLTPKVIVLGGKVSGRWLGHDGGALKNGTSVLIKTPESYFALVPFAMWGYTEKTETCRRARRRTPAPWSQNSSFQNWENTFLLFRPTPCIVFLLCSLSQLIH